MMRKILVVVCGLLVFASLGYSAETIKLRAYTKGKITSTGKIPTKGRTLALSRDILEKYKGKKVILRDKNTHAILGEYVAEDVMHKKYKKSGDIYMGKGQNRKARQFGKVIALIEVVPRRTKHHE